MFKKLPDLEYLHSRLEVNLETGEIWYKPIPVVNYWDKTFNTQFAGQPAGHVKKRTKRVRLVLDKVGWPYPRILWKMLTGEDPEGIIDHEDGDTLNNHPSNLRDISVSKNAMNRKNQSLNNTGIKNIHLTKDGYYRVGVYKEGKHHHVWCKTLEEASSNAARLRKELHGEFTRA